MGSIRRPLHNYLSSQEDGELPIPDFPKLSLEELSDLTLGVYQLKQAHSYTNEHMGDTGLYKLYYVKEQPNILRLMLQSTYLVSSGPYGFSTMLA